MCVKSVVGIDMKLIAILCCLVAFAAILCCNGIFPGEIILYRNQTQQLATSFTVVLNKTATVPRILTLNTICTVPDFQKYGVGVNVNNRRKRALDPNTYKDPADFKFTDSYGCSRVGYCNNDGMAGSYFACTGSKHQVVDDKCLQKFAAGVLDKTAALGLLAREQSYNLIADTVAKVVDGSATLLNKYLDKMGDTINTVIDQVEGEILSSLVTSTSLFTQEVKSTFDSIAQQTNFALNSLAYNNKQGLATLSNNLNAVADLISKNNYALSSTLTSTVLVNSKSINKLVSNLNDLVDATNAFYAGVASYNKALQTSIQTLMIATSNSMLRDKQGVDISSILLTWANMSKGTVMRDASNLNFYRYAYKGYVSGYEQQRVDADPQDEVVGKAVYQCFEEGDKIDYSASVGVIEYDSTCVAITSITSPNDTARCVRNLEQPCIDRLVTALSKPYSKLSISESASPYFTACAGDIYMCPQGRWYTTLTFYDYSGNVYFKYPYSTVTSGSSCIYYDFSCTYNSQCTGNPNTFTTTWGTLKPSKADRGQALYLVDDINGPLETVTREMVRETPTNVLTWGDFNTISSACTNNQCRGTKFDDTIPGNSNFYISHPKRGNIKIHRCTRVSNLTIVDDQGPLAELDGSLLMRQSNLYYPGKKVLAATGLAGRDTVQLLVRYTNTDREMTPTRNVYSTDKWCCDGSWSPILATANCTLAGLKECITVEVANCTVNSVKVLVKLTNGLCPGGTTPATKEKRWLSPRTYFCSSAGKNTKPLAYGLDYCRVDDIQLPGAGVSIETGVISPQGYYPASCMYWSDGVGRANLHTINIPLNDVVAPTMLANLRGQKVIFDVDPDKVVDEMYPLLGIGNGGFDCVTYEMDKTYYKPKDCTNFVLPEYNTTQYFSGKVRSTGLSRFLEYFDISLIDNNSTTVLLNFTLKAGIDYEAAYFATSNACPSLKVDYGTIQTRPICIVGGWQDYSGQSDIKLNGISVCNGGICTSSVNIPDNSTVTIDLTDSKGQKSNCYKFVCMAATSSFVGYPGETFNQFTVRDRKIQSLALISGYDYQGTVRGIMQQLQTQIVNTSTNYIKSSLGFNTVVNITAPLITPEFSGLASSVNYATVSAQKAILNITAQQQQLLRDQTRESLYQAFNESRALYNNQTMQLETLLQDLKAKINITVTVQKASLLDWVGRLEDAYKISIQGIALSAIALGASVVSSVFVLYVSFKC